MGCDIHIEVFVRKPNVGNERYRYTRVHPPSGWEVEPDHALIYADGARWPKSRNYAAFGCLAGVRGDPNETTPDLRGFPETLRYLYDPDRPENEFRDRNFGATMDYGDHSFTWVTLAELNKIRVTDYDSESPPKFYTDLLAYIEKARKALRAQEDDIIIVLSFDS